MARRWHHAVLMASALAPLAAAAALAGPNGANVVGGAATVQGQGTANVIVNQTTQSAIINWRTFNIGSGETTKIYMPNSNSTQLDRVTGGQGPSQILGTLSSNGKVFLVNPDGILFGMGARINVGSLVATTNDIADSDFTAGRYNFTIPGNPNASIANLGTITAQTGGFAALVAPGVRNTGTITARLGTIALASGNVFTLDMYGDNLITLGLTDRISSQLLDVATGKPLKSLVSNEGKLKANGGTVVLTAVAARKIVDSVINNSGVIEANTFDAHKGVIVLSAATGTSKYARSRKQTVKVSGTLSTAGQQNGTSGGTIQITGENIEVAGATINASGQAGGGTVLIGGDWGGGHPNTGLVANASAYLQNYSVPPAASVSIDAATTIDVSATGTGNGGKVIVWSNAATAFDGTILAKGGVLSGNGGFVETSGGTLTFNGAVNTSAANGKAGTWLLDPIDLTIDSAGATTISNGLASNNVVVYTDANGNTSGQGTPSSGPGDIVVTSAISWSSPNILTLSAYNAITVNAPITIAGSGGLVLDAASNPLAPAAPLISFGSVGSVQFTATPNTGQSVIINGQAYTLLYSMSDVQNINSNLSGNYALALPLDASSVTNWTPIGTNSSGGILNSGDGFKGAFQGLGNTISNLTINLPSSTYVGLFGYVGTGGLIQNVGTVGGSVVSQDNVGGLIGFNSGSLTQSYATGAVAGSNANFDFFVGGLAGGNAGTIAQSYATGSVSGVDGTTIGGLVGSNTATISQSYATGAVTGSNGSYTTLAGGLVGQNSGTITQSFASGTVADANVIGGLVGGNAGTIAQSYATGAVSGYGTGLGAGGLVGYNGANSGIATITQSYATGAVSGTTSAGYLGGLVGLNYNGSLVGLSNGSTSVINQSYATGAVRVTGSGSLGGLLGFNASGSTIANSYWDITTGLANVHSGVGNVTNASGVIGLTTAQFGNTANFPGWNFGTTPGGPSCSTGGACWVIVDTYGNFNNSLGALGATRPMLLSEYSKTITNPHQLQLMGLAPTANYTLANNIDLGPALANASDVWGPNGSAGFSPIGYSGDQFTGTFNGNGKTISNLTVNTNLAFLGLFSIVGAGGLVENLGVLNVNVSGGGSYAGGLVGVNSGTIRNSYTTGSVSALILLGGLVGENEGDVTESYSTATVATASYFGAGGLVGTNLGTVSQSYATGAVSGGIEVGGLVGGNGGTVIQSYATGAVSGGSSGSIGGVPGNATGGLVGANSGTITQSYATGTVSDLTGSGGLVGYDVGSVTSSYWDTQTSGLSRSAGGTGLTTAQLQSGLPSGFDVTAWGSNSNVDGGFPFLLWQLPAGYQVGPGSPPVNPGSPNNPDTNTVPTNTAFANQQVLQFTQPINFTTTNITPPLIDPATLTAVTGGQGGNPGNGPAGPGANGANGNTNTGNSGTLANGRQGGNGAPPGVRLIDMRVMPLPPGTGLPPPGETRFLPNQVVLQFGAGITPQQIAAVARRFGLTIVSQQTVGAFGRTVYTVQINNGRSVADVIRAVGNAGLNAAAQPNYTYGLTQDQADAVADVGDPAQYIVQKLQLGAVHRITEGNDVVVALIDSRVDTKQPDFAGRIVDTYDAGCGPDTPPDAHGTGMAGAIASHIGLLGVAPSAKIIAICAFGGKGSPEATSAKIITGLDYAIAHGAKIVNMSFAGPRDPALAQELQIAREKGILIVAAAGNAGPKSPPLYPGADPNVMAVTATDEHDRLFTGANQGSYVAVAAPGVNVLVPAPNGDVQFTTGTSVASANVSGVAALLMAKQPSRTPEDIRSILVSTAKHLGPNGMNPQFGAGLVDPLKALRFVPTALGGKSAATGSPLQPH